MRSITHSGYGRRPQPRFGYGAMRLQLSPGDKPVHALEERLPPRLHLLVLVLDAAERTLLPWGTPLSARPMIDHALRELFRPSLKSAQVAHNERFGVVTSDFTLYMSTDLDALNEAYRKWLAPEWRRRGVKLPEGFTCSGLASRDAIFIALESCSDDLRARGGPVAHEYFHILQHHLGLVGHSSSLVWPTWLIEGSAVYASVLHEEEQGRLTVSTWREVARLGWAGLGLRFPGLYEQAIDGHTPTPFEFAVLVYQVGFLAIEWLVERTGEEALLEFFQLGGGRQEFEKAFGMAADEFVAAFEEHRLEVAPPFESRIAGRVVDSDGKPVAFARVDTHIWIGQQPAWAGGDWTNTLGRFSFKGPDNGYTLKLSLRCPGGDFYDGRLEYMLVSGAGRDSFRTRMVSCGGATRGRSPSHVRRRDPAMSSSSSRRRRRR